ncbi:hypothetical protein E1A91_A11G299700v1 [Gossypium mustelinum]|uniref:Homeobox domain-containing protein n=4 Tax=Gossypium TaxID=3633 RepID=A0A2P5VVM5_GOSBA|nr:hypothetical protein ES319_A11G292500v1 [Gossypium barbadense]PPR82886.1 hypothetical protein GOBAR_AA37828 [Gossypium barbadense]TYG96088.1 hypothetical protein ES288_A11G319200v1 [Gossypium darwinii]TYI03141.1 hypothetical protein ES332_A11G315800v1 [Gossypium tomentosum]TYJ11778.1 hypothetical protein E1A91_A11G299700v1 [Gossypium mustelinum]
MEDIYRLDDTVIACSNDVVRVNDFAAAVTTDFLSTPVDDHHLLQFDHQETDTGVTGSSAMSDLIKTQIATHPLYPNLVSAYIECQKVGAPPELASLLEEIGRESHTISGCGEIGADPELDEFMESYCEVLHRYKEELSKPFDEATTFLTNIESQLSDLCKGALTMDYRTDEGAESSDEELSGGELVEACESQEWHGGRRSQDIKGMLMRKYSGYLSSLRKEFLKKRKNGKLPKDARLTLLDWWNNHYRWPYPTEEEKLKLSEMTGLDQKQINNWFINQRKRHWKPSEDMKFALMEDVAGSIRGGPPYFDTGAGTGTADDI